MLSLLDMTVSSVRIGHSTNVDDIANCIHSAIPRIVATRISHLNLYARTRVFMHFVLCTCVLKQSSDNVAEIMVPNDAIHCA